MLHCTNPWNVAADSRDSTIRLWVMYAVSRGMMLSEIRPTLGVPMAELNAAVQSLKQNEWIREQRSKPRFVTANHDYRIRHIALPFYAEIYDAVVPHVDPALRRLDDIYSVQVGGSEGWFGLDRPFGIVVRYTERPDVKRGDQWFPRSQLRVVPRCYQRMEKPDIIQRVIAALNWEAEKRASDLLATLASPLDLVTAS